MDIRQAWHRLRKQENVGLADVSLADSPAPDGASQDESIRLRHVVICAGTLGEWARLSDGQWNNRLVGFASVAHQSGVEFVSVYPYGPNPEDGSIDTSSLGRRLLINGVHIFVQPFADGRQALCEVLTNHQVASGGSNSPLSEETIGQLLFGSSGEPDLVVVLGPSDRLPSSVIWELAYSELVFINSSWSSLDRDHLSRAIEEFQTRHRRFGGVEA